MIKIDTIYACNDENLQAELNKIVGRIISIECEQDDLYKVIYDDNCIQLPPDKG